MDLIVFVVKFEAQAIKMMLPVVGGVPRDSSQSTKVLN